MKKTYLLFITLYSSLLFSQFNTTPPWISEDKKNRTKANDIRNLQNEFETYWKTHDYKKKGSGYKPFKRWEHYWKQLTDENGNIMTADAFWQAWEEKNKAKTLYKQRKIQTLPTSNWTPLGPYSYTLTTSWSGGQGRTSYICVDPSDPKIIYVGAPAGGIWKSVDAGLNWTPLSDQLPQLGVSGIAVDYSNPSTIYITTGDKDGSSTYSVGVLKSTDGGLTWNKTGLSFSSGFDDSGDIFIHPSNNQILWCATSSGIFKTIDAGATWKMVQAGNFASGTLRLKPNDPTVIYASSSTSFFKSTDSGDTFKTVTSVLPTTSSRMILDVTKANANYVYVMSIDNKGALLGIYKSVDGGTTFTKGTSTSDVLEATQGYYDLALAVSPTNAEEIYTGCLNIWKSTNGGTSFTKLNYWDRPTSTKYTHADIHHLLFYGSTLYVCSDGGLYQSTNNGSSFTSKTKGLQISQFYNIAVSKQSASKMVGGLQDNGGFVLNNATWNNYYGADGTGSVIDPTDGNKCYGFVQQGGGLYISTNGGVSYSVNVSAPSGSTGNWVTPIVINSLGEVFSGYADLYKLSGTAWTKINTTSFGTGNVDNITIDPSNDNIIYVSNEAVLYKSTDKGITFKSVYTAPTGITSISVHSTNSNFVYITTSGNSGGVFKSTDGAITFSSFSTGLPSIGKNIIKHQTRNSLNPLYLGTSLGVYYRDDSMTQWEAFDTNLPNVSITDLDVNITDAKLTAATYGRGIWQTPIAVETNPQNDLELTKFVNVSTKISCGENLPQVIVKNNGLNEITSIDFVSETNGVKQNYTWTGNLTSQTSTTIDLPILTTSKGIDAYTILGTITNDAFGDNNKLSQTFYTNDLGTVGVVNTFENPENVLLSVNEGGSGAGLWKKGIRTGDALATPSNNVYTTSLSGNYPDLTLSYLITSCYDLSNVVNPTLKFNLAFDIELNFDILYVQSSTDGGITWKLLGTMGTTWYNSNRTKNTNDCFNCLGAQWTGVNTTLKEYSYPLNNLGAVQNVMFRIVFQSDDATNSLGVVIDNLVVDGTLANENFDVDKIVIYPNPSNTIFNVSFGSIQIKSIEVYDISGKVIYSDNATLNKEREIKVDLGNTASGIYFMKINSDKGSTIQKIVKE